MEEYIREIALPPYGMPAQNMLAIIPLSIYFNKGRAKVKIGLCKGKKLYDKRETQAVNDARRNIERTMKEYSR